MGKKRYTKELLIEYLLRAARELGRTPMEDDMCNKNGYPSSGTYKHYFKRFNYALEAAGLPLNVHTDCSESKLITEMQRAGRELGKTPTTGDMCGINGYPEASTYMRHFETFNKALIAAGFNVNHKLDYTNEELILKLIELGNKLNRTPMQSDVGWENGYPSSTVYVNHFITFNNALKIAGFEPTKHTYDGTGCALCKRPDDSHWRYNLKYGWLCQYCHNDLRKRQFICLPINDNFESAHMHHLHLENRSDFVIYIPNFLHRIHNHSHKRPKSMITPNAIALDYWINEELYKELYYKGDNNEI